ncbi:MAG: N-acetyltransferase [Croceitalea sp.]|nr:N-acetyltransferase [Croceitalea sp.]
MIHYKQASDLSELEQILALQKVNLPQNITAEEMNKEGFVTVEHDLRLLKKMNDVCPHTIATIDNEVVGYALSMHPKFETEIEVLKPLFNAIPSKYKLAENFMVMGQICISKAHRGQGIFRGLYHQMKYFMPKTFPNIITSIDTNNQHSYAAHKAIGFIDLSIYYTKGKSWHLVIL